MIDPLARVPPHDDGAEAALIGCVLLDGSIFPKCRIATDDLFLIRHQRIWSACLSVFGRGQPIEPLTVLDELRVRGTLDEAGGEVETFVKAVEVAVNYDHYARIVREKAEARELIRLCEEGMQAGYAEQGRNGAVQNLIDGGTRIRDSFKQPTGANWISAKAIRAKPYTPPTHFLPNVILDSFVTILYGPAKVGKDFFLFAFLRAFTETGEFLGNPLPSGIGRVLYVSEEPEVIIRWRLEEFGVDTDKVEFLCRSDAMSMGWDPLVEEAGRRAVKFGASVIVFNTLSSLAGIQDENDAGEGNKAMRPVLAMSDKVKKAVLVVHHTNKSTEKLGAAALQMRGTTSFAGAADLLVAFAYHQGNMASPKREIYSVGRIIPVPVTMMELDMSERPWVYRALGPVANVEEATESDRVIIAALVRVLGGDNEWLPASSPKDDDTPSVCSISGLSIGTIVNRLPRLVASRSINRKGKGGKWDPFMYAALGARMEAK